MQITNARKNMCKEILTMEKMIEFLKINFKVSCYFQIFSSLDDFNLSVLAFEFPHVT